MNGSEKLVVGDDEVCFLPGDWTFPGEPPRSSELRVLKTIEAIRGLESELEILRCVHNAQQSRINEKLRSRADAPSPCEGASTTHDAEPAAKAVPEPDAVQPNGEGLGTGKKESRREFWLKALKEARDRLGGVVNAAAQKHVGALAAAAADNIYTMSLPKDDATEIFRSATSLFETAVEHGIDPGGSVDQIMEVFTENLLKCRKRLIQESLRPTAIPVAKAFYDENNARMGRPVEVHPVQCESVCRFGPKGSPKQPRHLSEEDFQHLWRIFGVRDPGMKVQRIDFSIDWHDQRIETLFTYPAELGDA